MFRIRTHWFWIRTWFQIHLFYWIQIWVQAVAEYGSNPDPDHSFYDKIVTCEQKKFVGIKNGHISLLKPLKRTFRLQKNHSATLNLKLEIYSFFLFLGTDLTIHDLCPTLLCWHRVILCIEISYLITGLDYCLQHHFHSIVHLNNKVIFLC